MPDTHCSRRDFLSDTQYSRRDFLCRSASCAAHVAWMSAAAPAWARGLWAAQERFPTVAFAPWARIERIADGVWAVISRPLHDRTTLCNGGIVAGRSGVVVIEAFASDAGARWIAEEAERLTGRAPTHVVLTHYHGDHTGGLRGARRGGAEILGTPVTRDLTRGNADAPTEILDRVTLLDPIRPTEIDLGDRSLIVVPRRGHTDSDVTVELSNPEVVFCGDLVWSGMFPNYMDATPSRLTAAVKLLAAGAAEVYVPGHGPVADVETVDRYLELLLHVEEAAREAVRQGLSAEEAGDRYRLPPGKDHWVLFNDDYFARAIGAWMRELETP